MFWWRDPVLLIAFCIANADIKTPMLYQCNFCIFVSPFYFWIFKSLLKWKEKKWIIGGWYRKKNEDANLKIFILAIFCLVNILPINITELLKLKIVLNFRFLMVYLMGCHGMGERIKWSGRDKMLFECFMKEGLQSLPCSSKIQFFLSSNWGCEEWIGQIYNF